MRCLHSLLFGVGKSPIETFFQAAETRGRTRCWPRDWDEQISHASRRLRRKPFRRIRQTPGANFGAFLATTSNRIPASGLGRRMAPNVTRIAEIGDELRLGGHGCIIHTVKITLWLAGGNRGCRVLRDGNRPHAPGVLRVREVASNRYQVPGTMDGNGPASTFFLSIYPLLIP
jgi:hypothetical protein